jgi:hypothetical protein
MPRVTIRAPLSDAPQDDERTRDKRRTNRLVVAVERRTGHDRRERHG